MSDRYSYNRHSDRSSHRDRDHHRGYDNYKERDYGRDRDRGYDRYYDRPSHSTSDRYGSHEDRHNTGRDTSGRGDDHSSDFRAPVTDSLSSTAGISALMIANNPQVAQATRCLRRLYVGNLPSHLPLTEAALMDYFVQFMKYLGFTTPDPVLSASLHQDRGYCFIEFRSVADTDAVLASMNGAEMADRNIRISRPKDYQVGDSDLQEFIVGYAPGSFKPPSNLLPVNAANNASGSGSGSGGKNEEEDQLAAKLAAIPQIGQDAIDATLPNLLPALGILMNLPPSIHGESRCIALHNLIELDDLVDDDLWLDTLDDVRQLYSNFGEIEEIIFPRPVAPLGVSDEIDDETGVKLDTGDLGPWHTPEELGKLFIVYTDVEMAKQALEATQGKIYGTKRIFVEYVDMEGVTNKFLQEE